MQYPGGKNGAGVFQAIINQMPPHEVYIEPFLGSGAVMRRKRSATVSIGVDRSALAATDVPDRFVNGDGIAFLENFPWTGRELVYADPPYVLSARASQRPIYQYELDDVDHRRLLRCLNRIPALAMVSGYASPLYDAMLQPPRWRVVNFQAMTRGGTLATEFLWCNFPEPAALHDYRFLGSDYRERERIKRKVARWRARALDMPVLERRAVLSALLELPSLEAAARDPATSDLACGAGDVAIAEHGERICGLSPSGVDSAGRNLGDGQAASPLRSVPPGAPFVAVPEIEAVSARSAQFSATQVEAS